ncbi:MAG: tetratricopeptide repeat protein, partial [Chloroflexi bacterium]|nr:tetratricopeptide repeat protein [Chloroflexota bacterium]
SSSDLQYRTYLALVWHYKYMACELLGKNEEAGAAIENVLICDPAFADFWYQRGCMHQYRGEYDEAIKQFDLALKYDANFADAYLGQGKSP